MFVYDRMSMFCYGELNSNRQYNTEDHGSVVSTKQPQLFDYWYDV